MTISRDTEHRIALYKAMNKAGWTPNRVKITASINHQDDRAGVYRWASASRVINTADYAILPYYPQGTPDHNLKWNDLVNEMLWTLIGSDTRPSTLRLVVWTAVPQWEHGMNTYFTPHRNGGNG